MHAAFCPMETIAQLGQLPSQTSPGSTMPLPHVGGATAQSLSVMLVQPEGQQPSSLMHVLIVPVTVHAREQSVPVTVLMLQPTFWHVVGQLPSQSSGVSTTLLPHIGAQSLSFV